MAPTRDYYGDLELPPSADITEIKKQFRKLALKYHPDRNPGREEEVNSKFQVIQSAHEILSDPQQKAKYDATLGRPGRMGGASGVRGNPWQDVGQQFPTPPRRTTAARNATSGAQRWQTRFSNGVPPTAKQYTAADSEAKKNAARAFENMRKNQSQGSNKTAQRETRSSQPPPPPPRSESSRQRAQASFGTRKTGFHPHSPDPGDEPPVSGQSYYTRASAERPQAPQPPPRKPVPTAVPDPLSQFRDRDGYAADTRQATPYSSHGGEKTNPFEGVPLGRARSSRESYRHDESTPSDDQTEQMHRRASAPKSSRKQGTGSGKNTPTEDGAWPHTSAEARNEYTETSFRSRTNAQPMSEGNRDAESHPGQATDKKKHPESQDYSKGGPSIFNFSVGDDAFEQTSPPTDPSRFAKNSVDDINTQFVNDDGSGTWQFSAGNDKQEGTQSSRPLSGSRANRRSPPKRPTTQRTDSSGTEPPPEATSSAFNANGWSDKFSAQTFVPQPAPSASPSPTRSTRANSRKVKARPTVGNAAVVDSGSNSDGEAIEFKGRNAQTKASGAESPQAMDIDSPPPASTVPPMQTGSARNIHVEPSRPEWRRGNVDAMADEAKPARPQKIPIDANAAGSEDSEEFRANFADLKNVPPFSQQNTGLGSFMDLKDNLPFESKASEELPIKLPKAEPLVFPTAPEAPRLPPTVTSEGIQPNTASWNKYLADFESYLKEWDDFNALVVDHFIARRHRINEIRSSKGYSFLRVRADGDVQEYYNWIHQDNDIRQRWNAACEDHERRFREFIAFRQQMK